MSTFQYPPPVITSNSDYSLLREQFRRLERTPDRKSPQRRDLFKLLISLVQSPDAAKKKLVTERVKDYFPDFRDLQEAAINAIYDICEDQEQSIRIAGYNAITSISIADPTWIVRNVDVLVQLLQSDEDVEVTVVKKQLQQHVDIDPRHTLQVLCDQCIFESEGKMDTDEVNLRTRLRGLVLQFLDEKLRGCILRVVKEKDVESILLKGMIGTIPHASPSELQIIVKNILTQLPSLGGGPSEAGNSVLLALLQSASPHILSSTTLSTSPSATYLLNVLSLASDITAPSSSQLAPRSIPSAPASMRQPVMHSPADALILLRFFKEKDILRKLPEGSKESTVKFVEIVFSAYESAFLISGSLKAKKEAQSILGEVAGSLLEALVKSLSHQSEQQKKLLLCLKILQAIHQGGDISRIVDPSLVNENEFSHWLLELQKILLDQHIPKESLNVDIKEVMDSLLGLIRKILGDIALLKTETTNLGTQSISNSRLISTIGSSEARLSDRGPVLGPKAGQVQLHAQVQRQQKALPSRHHVVDERNQEQQRRLIEEQRERARTQRQVAIPQNQNRPWSQGTIPTGPRGERRLFPTNGDKTTEGHGPVSGSTLSVRGAAGRANGDDTMDVDSSVHNISNENNNNVAVDDKPEAEGEPARKRVKSGNLSAPGSVAANGDLSGNHLTTEGPSLLSRLSPGGIPSASRGENTATRLTSRIGVPPTPSAVGMGTDNRLVREGVTSTTSSIPSLISRLSSSASSSSAHTSTRPISVNGGLERNHVTNVIRPSIIVSGKGSRAINIDSNGSATRDGGEEIKIRGAAAVSSSDPKSEKVPGSFGMRLMDRLQMDANAKAAGDGDGNGQRKRKLDRR